MTDPANHHPDHSLLQAYLAGGLPMGVNLAVSAHIDQCETCQQALPPLAVSVGDAWLSEEPDSPEVAAGGLDAIFNRIVQQPAPAPARPGSTRAIGSATKEAVRVTFNDDSEAVLLRDRPVKLPRLLGRIARGGLQWKEIAAGIHQALLDVDSKTKCEYIYMDPGARVPEHTHLGHEFMLVLDGRITDGFGDYGVGDFVARQHEDCHGQVSEGGCICLFVTDAPLIFTEGKARLLNPMSRIRYWWSKFGLG